MAEPERWTYQFIPTPPDKPLPILENYIKQTFVRAYTQSKISYTERSACFNTGLLTPSQEEIFGYFTVSDNYNPDADLGPTNKRWFLRDWVRAGDRKLMDFPELPAMATYWTNPNEVVFDPSLRVELNVDHIIRDNLIRFPEELGGRLGRDGVPHEAGVADIVASDDPTPPPSTSSPANDIPLAARNALQGAMEHSIRLAKRSYRIAVPQFHREKVQLLLPLHLRDASRADLALTLENVGSWYRAATVLYTDWAYSQARLLTRPNSEWLGGFRSDIIDGGTSEP